MRVRKIIVAYIFIFFISLNSFSQTNTEAPKYWIIFKDKGTFKSNEEVVKGTPAYDAALSTLTDRAIQRRLKVLPENKLVDFKDIPVYMPYVEDIQAQGVKIIAKSRWFNGVSSYLTDEQLSKIKKLDYVGDILLLQRSVIDRENKIVPMSIRLDELQNIANQTDSKFKYNYGKSFSQLNQINVPKLHNLGIIGKGVKIASFDSGFEWRDHEALRNLNITDEYDFIDKDKNTANEPGDAYVDVKEQSMHGTATLSNLAGFKEGKLIGPAFGSEIILGKTEYTPTETPMEEDFYLEATEWAEAQGVDVITSSLGYRNFDPEYAKNSYKYEDFNGNVAITTLAGKRAAYLGVVVVASNGNYHQTQPPSIGSPADGDSIIGVGAVDINNNIASFSSNGPTADGRIKPDVCALGIGNLSAVSKQVSNIDSGYTYMNGTSFSCPITAGVCALILSAHPELTPMQVRDVLRKTADRSFNPDNTYGWGLIDAYSAIMSLGIAFSNEPQVESTPDGTTIKISIASKNPINENDVRIFYSTDDGETYTEKAMEISNQLDNTNSGEYKVTLEGVSKDNLKVYFTASDATTYGTWPIKGKDAPITIK